MENRTLQPYDLRLACLRLIMQWRRILALTGAGILLLGGGYILKYIVCSPAPLYGAESTYYVEYGTDPVTGNAYTYINAYSWNEWLHTEEFLDDIAGRLESVEIGREELSQALHGDLPSDLRMPVTLVTTGDPEQSMRVAEAVEESMVAFADRQKEIDSIRVVTPAHSAEQIKADVRPVRAIILSAVVSGLAAVLFLFIRDTWLPGIWLPIQVRRDYGIHCLIPEQRDVKTHMDFLLGDCARVGLFSMGSSPAVQSPAGQSVETAQEICAGEGRQLTTFASDSDYIDYEGLRQADGVILVLTCGEREGGGLQAMLEELELEKIPVKGALLYGTSPFLRKTYYCLRHD